jgi:3-phosphoshikimate 1-carboxyvinyltransferase
MGAEFTFLEKEGHLPVKVKGAAFGGKQPAAEVDIDISKSTQFLSALMMVAPMLENGLKIHITSKKTDGSYIRITSKMMQQFGCKVSHSGNIYEIKAKESYALGIYRIEPDVSAACYFYAMAALTGGSIVVKNVHTASMQGDIKFLDVLKQMGCVIEETSDGIRVTGTKNGEYPGVDIDMNDFSDQTMTLAALAPFAKSATTIRNIGHIRLQESDRIHAIVTELTKLGIAVEEGEDYICIQPGKIHGGVVSTYDDHRMAMAFALIGLRTEEIVIDDFECCKKTFENYFEVLDDLLKE